MSHTLHRQGAPETLKSDFIVFSMSAKEINHVGSHTALARFLEIAYRHNPVNMGDIKTGNLQKVPAETIIGNMTDTSIVHAVFTDPETVAQVLCEVKEADLGNSVILSGLFDELGKCLEMAGLETHTREHSLGIKGKLGKLPDRDVLKLTTMCGHGMVAASAVLKAVKDVKRGRGDPGSIAKNLAKPCECGVFNPARAGRLLTDIASVMTFDW
jgi:hypothetical protein